MNFNKHSLLQYHLITIFMAAGALFSKYISIDAIQLTAWRTLIATIFFIALYNKRLVILKTLTKKDVILQIFSGILLGTHWITFFHALKVSTVSVGMLSLHIYPVLTVLLEPLFHPKRIHPSDLVLALIVFIGIFLLVPKLELSDTTTQGIMWGVFSAFLFTLRNLIMSTWASNVSGSFSMLFQVSVIALLMSPIWLSSGIPSANDLGFLLILAIGFTAFTHTMFVRALRQLNPATASLISCLQPVYATVYAFLLFQEIPTGSTVIGGLLILSAAMVESWRFKKRLKVQIN